MRNLDLLGASSTPLMAYFVALATVVFGGFFGLVVIIYMMQASLHLYGWLIGKLLKEFLPPEQETDLAA